MGEQHPDDPDDDELIRFAAQLLGPQLAGDEELLRAAIHEARSVWLLLYRASKPTLPD